MATRKQCLQYVANTAGNATADNFREDWEPVGNLAWRDLEDNHLAEANADGKIALTDKGRHELAKLQEKTDG